MSEQLVRELVELGRSVPTPEAPGLEAAVLARVGEPGRRPVLGRRQARLVAGVLAALLALLAAPPVRAAVADWFGFGAVVVHRGEGDGPRSGAPVSPPPIGPGTSLADAAAQVEFVVFELPSLGDPQGADVSRDRRVLSLGWAGGIRLDQSSSLSYTFDKTSLSVIPVTVDGREAIWFEDSHDLVLLDEDGRRMPDTGRPAGRTLVWTIGDTTLRLEGATLTSDRAIEIAESARPVH
jgi:hypothetical protein